MRTRVLASMRQVSSMMKSQVRPFQGVIGTGELSEFSMTGVTRSLSLLTQETGIDVVFNESIDTQEPIVPELPTQRVLAVPQWPARGTSWCSDSTSYVNISERK
jgi:hypothetical protein